MSKLSRGIGAAILMGLSQRNYGNAGSAHETGQGSLKKDTATISGTVTAVTDTSLTIVDATKAEHTSP